MRNALIDLLDDLVEVKSEFVSLKAVLLSKEEEIQALRHSLKERINFILMAIFLGWKEMEPHIALNVMKRFIGVSLKFC
jgi:hypothetical protein